MSLTAPSGRTTRRGGQPRWSLARGLAPTATGRAGLRLPHDLPPSGGKPATALDRPSHTLPKVKGALWSSAMPDDMSQADTSRQQHRRPVWIALATLVVGYGLSTPLYLYVASLALPPGKQIVWLPNPFLFAAVLALVAGAVLDCSLLWGLPFRSLGPYVPAVAAPPAASPTTPADPSTAPPSGITCLMPVSAEKSAYYVGSLVNQNRLALLVVTNSGPDEAEFRVELQQVFNTKVPVQIRPGPLRWADESESTKLSPGKFGVVQIGYLEKVGLLAQVLRLLGPGGELTLEPGSVVGRRAVSNPEAQAIAQVRMMGLALRVMCDGVPEMFSLILQFTGQDEALLQVIEWPDRE